MDKFRAIITDPFYYGAVEIKKQINRRNENGLHEPMITKDQHLELVNIMAGKKKTQSGPPKNGNPNYPLSNHVSCGLCVNERYGRYAGLGNTNGRNKERVYEMYRCRSCRRRLNRDQMHSKITSYIGQHSVSDAGLKAILSALEKVWQQKEGQAKQEANRLHHTIKDMKQQIQSQTLAAIDPTNAALKEDIIAHIEDNKLKVAELEGELTGLSSLAEADRQQFLEFAFGFIDNMGERFLEISKENRLRCKQILFPAGFYLDAQNNVYTPEISELYRLAGNKKDLPEPEKSLLVRAS